MRFSEWLPRPPQLARRSAGYDVVTLRPHPRIRDGLHGYVSVDPLCGDFGYFGAARS